MGLGGYVFSPRMSCSKFSLNLFGSFVQILQMDPSKDACLWSRNSDSVAAVICVGVVGWLGSQDFSISMSGMVNLVYNFSRLARLSGRTAPA